MPLTAHRIYALTYLNRPVAMLFASITLAQFVVGVVEASMWNRPGMRTSRTICRSPLTSVQINRSSA